MKVVKKVVKGVGKAVKGIVKGVKKVFKAITKSKIGKALLIGATIYFGGAALGMWNSPFQAINGALTKAGSTAMTAGKAGADAAAAVNAGAAAGGTAPGIMTGAQAAGNAVTAAGNAAGQSIMAGVGAPGMTAAGGGVLAPGANAAAFQAAGATAGQAAAAGGAAGSAATNAALAGLESSRSAILTKLINGGRSALDKARGIGGWMQDHPTATMIGMNAAASALSPDQMDLQENNWKREDEERRRREKNLNVAGIDIGTGNRGTSLNRLSTGKPLNSSSYGGGILQRYRSA